MTVGEHLTHLVQLGARTHVEAELDGDQRRIPPLILDDSRLYLERYWRYESQVIAAARAGGMAALAFAGQDAGPMREQAELVLEAPSRLTPVVQQVHIVAAHLLVALVERALHPRAEADSSDPPDAVAPTPPGAIAFDAERG